MNVGHNTELMSQCQILREYSIYVAKVRVFTEQMPVDAAVQKAVAECIHENILADFLRKNQAEVIAMSIFEYDKEEEEKKLRKAEFEAGVEHGIEPVSYTHLDDIKAFLLLQSIRKKLLVTGSLGVI